MPSALAYKRVIEFKRDPIVKGFQDGNPYQLWAIFETSTGIKIMNVGEKDLLQANADGIYEWTYDESTRLLLDSEGTGKALQRPKKKKFGKPVRKVNYAPYNGQNRFVFEPIEIPPFQA